MAEEIARPLEVIEQEIQFYKQTAGESILQIGRRLIEAKAQLEHGEWSAWLSEKVEFSEASAQRFMRLAREYPNPSPVTDLGTSKALLLLALPENEREDFATQKHEVNGIEKSVSEMSKRELEKVIRERDEATLKAEETKKEAERLAKELSDAKSVAEEAKAALEKAEAEMEEMQKAPIEATVVTEVSEEEKEAIRQKEAEKFEAEKGKLQARIDKLTKAKEDAEAKAKKAAEQLATAKGDTDRAKEQADSEIKNLTAKIAELNKKLTVSSSSDMTAFKAHFEIAKQSVGHMLEVANKDIEEAPQLRQALKSFCEAIIEKVK